MAAYKECLKNHAVDGCGEFMPSPTSISIDPTSLKFAACGCHRNFHRREPEDLPPPSIAQHVIEYQPQHRHHPPVLPRSLNSASPLPISSAYYPSAPHMLLALSARLSGQVPTENRPVNSSGTGNPNGRKRHRTKFTQDQNERMLEFAERVGWKTQKKDDEVIAVCCSNVGVGRGHYAPSMAALCCASVVPSSQTSKPLNPNTNPLPLPLPPIFPIPKPFLSPIPSLRSPKTRPTNSAASSSSTEVEDDQKENQVSMSIDALQRFVDLNLGNWIGFFYQFDPDGNLLHKLSTKLAVSSYGEDELLSLIQTLYIKQPPSTTSISGDAFEPEWAEYKIKETNMFTVDKYQQIGFFPNEKAFALRYQTAGMLETVLRQGVLGEDDTGEESPKNLKLPSRRPSIVCENCLYSLEKDMRARAFHILDPKGIVEMLLIFLEERGCGVLIPPSLDNSTDNTNRIVPYLGKWKGHSITKRSGVYGATIAEAETITVLEINDEGQLIQRKRSMLRIDGQGRIPGKSLIGGGITLFTLDIGLKKEKKNTGFPYDKIPLADLCRTDITSTSSGDYVTTNVHWTGTISNSLVKFDGGFQVTLLPGGMYMGCPSDVAKSVAESKSFHLEFCWLESPGKRQRLVRTYDVEGLAVSSTYFFETKL
ncbi:unnamed protein product [Camellia sinensis]